MKGYYFSKYGLVYKSKDEKNTKFVLLNPDKKEIPKYVKNQIRNENIYWQNRQTIINYYKSFKDNLNYFSSSTNFPIDTFKFFRKPSLYNNMNNKTKLQRFRNFFWFSFPFYILEATWNPRSFLFVIKIPYFFLYFYKMVLSKIFYIAFSLFGDLIINADYDPSIKAPKIERNFFRFLTIKSNTNKTILELSNAVLSQFLSFSPEISSDTNSNEKKSKLAAKSQKQSNKLNVLKIQNEITKKRLSVRKKRRYQRYLKRKKGTLKKVSLQNSKKYSFSNKFNSQSFFSEPKIEMLDFYKLLEYFYFVLTNDIDFYENAQFLAKVALLRQKYGQPIVSDLLNREDHKQASKVSVQMHLVDYEALPFVNSQKQESNSSFNTANSNNESEELEKIKAKNSFYMKQSKSVFYKKPNNFRNK